MNGTSTPLEGGGDENFSCGLCPIKHITVVKVEMLTEELNDLRASIRRSVGAVANLAGEADNDGIQLTIRSFRDMDWKMTDEDTRSIDGREENEINGVNSVNYCSACQVLSQQEKFAVFELKFFHKKIIEKIDSIEVLTEGISDCLLRVTLKNLKRHANGISVINRQEPKTEDDVGAPRTKRSRLSSVASQGSDSSSTSFHRPSFYSSQGQGSTQFSGTSADKSIPQTLTTDQNLISTPTPSFSTSSQDRRSNSVDLPVPPEATQGPSTLISTLKDQDSNLRLSTDSSNETAQEEEMKGSIRVTALENLIDPPSPSSPGVVETELNGLDSNPLAPTETTESCSNIAKSSGPMTSTQAQGSKEVDQVNSVPTIQILTPECTNSTNKSNAQVVEKEVGVNSAQKERSEVNTTVSKSATPKRKLPEPTKPANTPTLPISASVVSALLLKIQNSPLFTKTSNQLQKSTAGPSTQQNSRPRQRSTPTPVEVTPQAKSTQPTLTCVTPSKQAPLQITIPSSPTVNQPRSSSLTPGSIHLNLNQTELMTLHSIDESVSVYESLTEEPMDLSIISPTPSSNASTIERMDVSPQQVKQELAVFLNESLDVPEYGPQGLPAVSPGGGVSDDDSQPNVIQVMVSPGSSVEIPAVPPRRASTRSAEESASTLGKLEDKIIKKILQNCEFFQLKTARLVHPEWAKMATEILQKRDCCSVVIKYDTKPKVFRQSSYAEWNSNSGGKAAFMKPPLKYLNRLLKNPKTPPFPCASYGFLRGDLSHRHVQSFFKMEGHKIKQLIIKADVRATSKETLKDILENYVPNLTYLELRDFHNLKQNWKRDEIINMPNLSYFKFIECNKTAAAIIRGAPKLTEIFDPIADFGRVNVVAQCGKFNLVKKISCDEDTEVKTLTFFSSPGKADPPRGLESLQMFIDKKYVSHPIEKKLQLATSMSMILDLSKATLEDLYLSGLYPCDLLDLPRLENLKFLDLDWASVSHPTACFPKGLNLPATFPNLNVLDCGTLHCSQDSDWRLHFPPGGFTGVLQSVETLCISDSCNDFWMDKLHQLCPNFKTLFIWAEWEMATILPKIFKKWRHLESLKLEIFRLNGTTKKRIWLDPALTGLVEEDCTRLFKPHPSMVARRILESRGPSLIDLKELKNLIIVVNVPLVEMVRVIKNGVPLTKVSGIFAFRRMLRLKVCINYDQNCQYSEEITKAFESIAPYVNFGHKHDCNNDKILSVRKNS